MIIITVLVLLFDRATKFLATEKLTLNQSLPVIKNVIHITLVHNTGAAFGILKNQLYFLILFSLIAIVFVSLSLKASSRDKRMSLQKLSLCLVLSGAIGNLIDRLLYGYVIDFLDLRIWPVFNVADSAITIGMILLGYSILTKEALKKSK